MKHLITLIIIATLAGNLALDARTRTTRAQLRNDNHPVELIADTTLADTDGFSQHDITLKGYNKRASDSKETFFVTNNTSHRISCVRLLFRYSGVNGEKLHEREVSVPVALKPGETKLASVTSWDVQHSFYYYASSKPRKNAIAYTVAYRVLGYDVPVGK